MIEGVAVETASIYPDASVIDRSGTAGKSSGQKTAGAPFQVATLMPEAIPHVTVEIRDTAHRQLVTAIEILSPYNKRGEGLEEYLTKQGKILLSSAHLLEIDLLRSGQRVPMRQALPSAPYFVFLSRAWRRPLTDVWPVRLDQPLPPIPVPLLAGDDDVTLDLAQAFSSVYESCGYDLDVDYTRPPEVPLTAEEAALAAEWIRAWQQGRKDS